jgi:hypothetical protein
VSVREGGVLSSGLQPGLTRGENMHTVVNTVLGTHTLPYVHAACTLTAGIKP